MCSHKIANVVTVANANPSTTAGMLRLLFTVRKLFTTILVLCTLCLTACGYTLRGMEGHMSSEILGDGNKTFRITEVEQTSMFPWLPYTLRSAIIEGIQQRGFGKVVATGVSDLVLQAKVTNYSNSSDNNASAASYLFTIDMTVEFTLRNGSTNEIVWQSGGISYSDSYQSETEATAAAEVAKECVRRAFDRLQQSF